MAYRNPVLILVLAVLLAAACSSDDGGDDDWLPDDIDREATLAAAGDAAYARLCTAFEDYVHDQYASSYLVQAACTVHAIETTTSAEACADAIDACLSELPPTVEAELDRILDQAGCSALAIEPTGCSATVAEVKACLDAFGERLDSLQLVATCAAAGQPVDDAWSLVEPPAACLAIENRCPIPL